MVRIFVRFSTEYLSVFSPNAGKSEKNADQNNSEYGLFLRRVIVDKEHSSYRKWKTSIESVSLRIT